MAAEQDGAVLGVNSLEDCSCSLVLQRCDCFSVVGAVAVAVFIRVAIIAWWRDGVERQIFAARELWLLKQCSK